MSNHPSLTVFDRQIEQTEAEAVVADFMRKPMIGGGLQYMPQVKRKPGDVTILPNTGRDMVMPMFTMTVPIWKKKYDAAVQERQLMKEVYSDMKEEMYNELSAMYEMTLYEMDKMQQMIELFNTQMTKTQQAIELLMASYQNGASDFEEVLRLQQQLFKYQIEKVSAQTGYHLAQVKLNYLTGN
ncbi:MAG: TolC family protein [Saprospiraceae bacterium]|nr:TolC family protein [Saprospiraceae bacterium]